MFLLADVTFYIAVLAAIGKQPLAVTTNCSINFMRKPNPNDLIADARILKKGRSLIVGDVLLRSSLEDLTVAQASFTYAIPHKEL
jgi:acyl-coenzyme A thioesterase PaaI-like protein